MTQRTPTPGRNEISSIKDPAVLGARQRLGQVGGQPPVSYLVEGYKMALQALSSPAEVEAIFLRAPAEESADRELERETAARGVPCRVVSRGVFVRLHDLGYETSVTVLTTVKRQFAEQPICPQQESDCLLIGERIQDPKNLGSLIRTADAWGVVAAAFSADSADPFSRGSVRPSTGSILRVPLVRVACLTEYLGQLKSRGVRLIATSAQAPTPCWTADLTGPCALLLGNESVGLSEPVRRLCDASVSIPMCGGAHSFNVAVAAGILLYERTRQRSA